MRERYVAREYARLLLRYEPDECASIKSFFAEIGRASKAEPRLASFLCHPAIPREARDQKVNLKIEITQARGDK